MTTKELIPALEERLAQAGSPKQRVDLINQTAWELCTKDAASAKDLAEKSRRAATQGQLNDTPYRAGLAESLHILCRCEALLGNYAQSISLGMESLEIFEEIGDLAGQGRVYNAIGITYLYLGNYPRSLTALLESLDIFNESADVEWQARVLNNLGVLHLEIDEPERALTYLTSGLDLARQHHLTFLLGELLNSACNAYCATKEYNKALRCGLESTACYREVGAPRGESKALNSVGEVYQAQGKFDQALQAHSEALELASAVDFKFEIIEALLHIGQIHRKTGQAAESLAFFGQALDIAQEINARQKIYTAYRSLAEAYKQMGNYKEALEHFEKFQAVERSVFNSQADNRLKSLQVMHQLKDARHQAEISRLSNVELQRQINEREQLISDLEAFSHMVAHDLRNPLASIMMSLSMLNELKSRELGPDGREYLRIARNMADRMAAIIRELLVLASVRQKDVTLVVVDMGEITKSALDILSFQIEQGHAKIIMPDEWPQVFGYPTWIEEIWTNYISNALKYGGDPPIVHLGYTRQENGRIRFWVHDNGDGISPEKQDRLFAPFSQLDHRYKRGYGLGLSIVQRIAAKLNGEVGVESSGQPGAGSTFYFTLPGMIELA